MKKILIVIALGLIAIISCKREPIILPAVVDNSGGNTTNTGGNNTNSSGTNTTIIIYVPTNPTGNPCSPDSVYFNQQILPILTSSCAMSSCHDVASRKDGVILTNYEFTLNTGKINLLNPASSTFYRCLSGSGSDFMPPSPRPALTAAQKALILKWIQQGAKNLTCSDNKCDSSVYSFSAKIKPILDTKCLGCHNTASAGGGINYSTYAGIKASVDDGKLWGSINHQSGFKAMPQNYNTKLPDCELTLIRKWIQSGAPNN